MLGKSRLPTILALQLYFEVKIYMNLASPPSSRTVFTQLPSGYFSWSAMKFPERCDF